MFEVSLETLRIMFQKEDITVLEAVKFALLIHDPIKGKDLRKALYNV